MRSKRVQLGRSDIIRCGYCRHCSADGLLAYIYFMVPKSDLGELNTSVQSQRATLVTMETTLLSGKTSI